MISDELFLKVLRSAVKSPSGHNTQPWKFSKTDDGICIGPDFSRALPVADPYHRELYISLGCAAETAMIAARFYGYYPAMQIIEPEAGYTIKIMMQRDDNIVQPELFSFINTRQTTRNLYDDRSIPVNDLETMETMVSEPGVGIRFFAGQNEIRQLGPFIAEASAMQIGNPEFKNELIRWMRFSEKEAMHKGDGLYTASSGIPSIGRVLGSIVLKTAVTPGSETKRLLKQLENSAAVVLFTSPGDNTDSWIKTGMAFQRFSLTATRLNLSHSFLNPPCQIAEVREKLSSGLGLAGEYPQLLIRLGYSKKMPYSLRRNTCQVIAQ